MKKFLITLGIMALTAASVSANCEDFMCPSNMELSNGFSAD